MDSEDTREEAIRLRAYELYQARGCEHGHDQEDWLLAQAEILALSGKPEVREPALDLVPQVPAPPAAPPAPFGMSEGEAEASPSGISPAA
jgi:hypothetical protein